MNDICIRMENVYKEYTVADVKVQALNNVSFSVKKGEYIRNTIKSWEIPFVKEVRGKGLMIGIQLDSSVKPFDVEVECLNQGLCTTVAGSDVVRFLPPLNISYKEIDEGLAIFEYVLEGFCK